MLTVLLAGNGARREVVLEEIHSGTQVEVLIRRAILMLGVQEGNKMAMRCKSRLLKAEETLVEAGVSARDVVDICVGEGGGMLRVSPLLEAIPGVKEPDAMPVRFEQLSQEVSGIESALQHLKALQEGGETQSGIRFPMYGGEYLEVVMERLKADKESNTADASRADQLSKQVDVLERLNEVMKIRQSEDISLRSSAARNLDGTELRGVRFDVSEDDAEVLLKLFREVDADGNGTISTEELSKASLLQKKENAGMARVLQRSLGCDLQALEEALAPLVEKDLYLQRGVYGVASNTGDSGGHVLDRRAAVNAIFEAIGPSWPATVSPEADQAAAGGAGEVLTRLATRADLDRFLASAPVKGSVLASALEKLAAALPREEQLDFLALKEAARKVPRVAAQRLEWVRTMRLDAALARHLPPGTLDDG
jgi:hypothetical protein